MGFRFRKSISIIPGVKVNLSKGMPSVSVGEKGFTYNVSEKGERTTVGLPGSGMSYSSLESSGKKGKKGTPVIVIILMAGAAYLLKYLPTLLK